MRTGFLLPAAALGLLSPALAAAPTCPPGPAPRAAEVRPVSGPSGVPAAEADSRPTGDAAPTVTSLDPYFRRSDSACLARGAYR